MALDLAVLLRRARECSEDPAEREQFFWSAVEESARGGDLLAYGLFVHGDQAEELKLLALSRHARVIALDCEGSRLTAHILPPEHGKSALARWEAEMWLGVETVRAFADPGHTVPSAHYIMNTAAQAEKQVMEIENTIERNRRYRLLFPGVKPDKRLGWTKDHFFLQRPRSRPDPSLQGCGMFGPIQGSRVGLQLVDDPTDQQDARSDQLMRSQTQWLMGTAADRLLRGGIRRFRFTRWSDKDCFSAISRVSGMTVRVMPALDYWGPGQALWPEVWSRERLDAKRQELIDAGQAYLWQLTFMCDPRVASGEMFRRVWFVYGAPQAEAEGREEAAV